MTCDGSEVPYDVTQRAYVISSEASVISSEAEKSSSLHIDASKDHPACGLCLIIPGIDKMPSEIKVDGEEFKDFKSGIRTAWDGPSLILWLPVTSERPVDIALTL